MKKVFQSFQILFIDDIDLIDEESIVLLTQIVQLKTTFCIVTRGSKKNLSPKTSNSLHLCNFIQISLYPIHPIYHKMLAGLFLQIDALHIDIENIIRKRCKGNPGQIKTLLMSLLFDEQIKINQIRSQEAKSFGFVFTMTTDHKLIQVIKKDESTKTYEFCMEADRKYQNFQADINDNKLVKVATLSPNFNSDFINFEETEDGKTNINL